MKVRAAGLSNNPRHNRVAIFPVVMFGIEDDCRGSKQKRLYVLEGSFCLRDIVQKR